MPPPHSACLPIPPSRRGAAVGATWVGRLRCRGRGGGGRHPTGGALRWRTDPGPAFQAVVTTTNSSPPPPSSCGKNRQAFSPTTGPTPCMTFLPQVVSDTVRTLPLRKTHRRSTQHPHLPGTCQSCSVSSAGMPPAHHHHRLHLPGCVYGSTPPRTNTGRFTGCWTDDSTDGCTRIRRVWIASVDVVA